MKAEIREKKKAVTYGGKPEIDIIIGLSLFKFFTAISRLGDAVMII